MAQSSEASASKYAIHEAAREGRSKPFHTPTHFSLHNSPPITLNNKHSPNTPSPSSRIPPNHEPHPRHHSRPRLPTPPPLGRNSLLPPHHKTPVLPQILRPGHPGLLKLDRPNNRLLAPQQRRPRHHLLPLIQRSRSHNPNYLRRNTITPSSLKTEPRCCEVVIEEPGKCKSER
jgi:hypothetical protein